MTDQNTRGSSFPDCKETKERHWDAVKAMAQAAVNLELFTIPLYMTSMYSLTGMHQITTGNDLYRGRWWPGMKVTADPDGFPYYKKDAPDFGRMPKVKGIWYPEDPSYEAQKLITKTNNRIFNVMYKVFIEEMMHLQMAGNLAKMLGVEPSFTHKDLLTHVEGDDEKSFGWHCFDPVRNDGRIPYILNTADLKGDFPEKDAHNNPILRALAPLNEVEVRAGELDVNQITLFRIIECPMTEARAIIQDDKWKEKYLQNTAAPFDSVVKTTADLPLFGSIGRLYQCLLNHLKFTYGKEDGREKRCNLLQYILHKEDRTPYPQRDRFNDQRQGHPHSEYPGYDTTLMGADAEYVMARIKKMINAITEQGEGGPVENLSKHYPQKARQETDGSSPIVGAVPVEDQADAWAIEHNYKSYDDTGNEEASARGYARTHGFPGISKGNVSKMDHEEIFTEVQTMMSNGDMRTWRQWFEKGNSWAPGMLESDDYTNNKYSKAKHEKKAHALPDAKDVSDAMNRLKAGQSTGIDNPHDIFSQAAAGSIKGVIAVLKKYWGHGTGAKTAFPSPAMGGTADRLSICYSILGKAPDLVAGVKNRASGETHLHHACQGLRLKPTKPEDRLDPLEDLEAVCNNCADVSLYHTCIGSNKCRAEGGCGYVQPIVGGHSCGGSSRGKGDSSCSPGTYSPPSNNACAAMGGCAVPISASQLFPKPPKSAGLDPNLWARMQLHDYEWTAGMGDRKIVAKGIRKEGTCEDETVSYQQGDNVYQTAWEMHLKVLESRKKSPVPEPVTEPAPAASDIRLAFPPST